MQFISLASSSKGNCYYVGNKTGGVLFDCGISTRRIVTMLSTIPGALDNLKAVFITHEHRDHIKGLPVFLKRYGIPCYGSSGTLEALYGFKGFDPPIANHLRALSGESLIVGDMAVAWTDTSHDASEPVGYSIQTREAKIGILTDTGILTSQHKKLLHDSDLIFLEANHDVDMLRRGAYPAFLKQRIIGQEGHLSNDDCAEGLCDMVTSRTKHVILGHLSEENNRPELAFHTIRRKLKTVVQPAQVLKLSVAAVDRHLQVELPACMDRKERMES